mmetsp:Transcript_11207/g.22486  ORF Transcript_11207/g.22486 Transcript_11207/m.22486 type:complete len:135 (-) Transcript_11207:329-733(-)
MTMVALGAAAEGRGKGITGNSLWPATVIESFAAKNFKLGETSTWRKATILADCVVKLAQEPDDFTGKMLIDDTYLRTNHGFQDEDFIKYRFDPAVEPPRLLAMGDDEAAGGGGGDAFKRGDVQKLEEDLGRSKL